MKKGLIFVVALSAISLAACNFGDEGSSGEVNTVTLKSADETKAAIGEKFYAKMHVDGQSSEGESESEDIIGAQKEHWKFYSMGSTVSLLGKESDKWYQYSYDSEEEKYNYRSELDEVTEPYDILTNLFMVAGSELSYNTKESVTKFGRPCTKYTYESKKNLIVASVSLKQEYIIDDASNILFSYKTSGEAFGPDGGGSASANFEVTEFELGSAVDTFFNNEIAKIELPE